MISSNMCFVPPSVELLAPTTQPVFKPGITTARFQSRLTPLVCPVAYLGGLTRSDVHPLPGDDSFFWHASIATYGEEMDLLHAGRVKSKIRDILSITVGHTTHREMLRLIQTLMG